VTPDELEGCRCAACGKPVDQWLEVYCCRHVTEPAPAELGVKIAVLFMCSRCVGAQFGRLPDPPVPEVKPS
jgi:hypothetical protein